MRPSVSSSVPVASRTASGAGAVGFEPVCPVVIAPTYHNAATLPGVLARTLALGLPLIVVNDGSTDGTQGILEEWKTGAASGQRCVVAHERNRGKAEALRTGFAEARRRGFTHAVTIDTDGQLDPEEIPSMLEAARRHPTALVLGRRSGQAAQMPGANRLGWHMSALGIWLETGVRVSDSQCGLRVYPLKMFERVRCRAGRFGFEAEIITRAVWAGHPLVEVPVTCHYPEGARRVSHFRPWRDGLHGFFMHAALTLRRLFSWPRALRRRTAATADPALTVPRYSVREWLDPRAAIRLLHADRLSRLILAASFGIGTFVAAMPLAGLQPVAAAYVSWRLQVPLWTVLAGSLLMVTPAGPPLAALAINIGHVVLHGRFVGAGEVQLIGIGAWEWLQRFPVSWPLGGVVVGFFSNWVTIASLVMLFRLVSTKSKATRS